MANRAAAIKETDVKRILKGALSAGFEIGRVEVEVEGGKLVLFVKTAENIATETPLEKWKREHGAGED
ncbi:MAG: hypothetical protein IT541_16075 [Hyphomicrobiales bacterium]|nr:hypothetical protein [Hyphomicrobiales bacterium]